MESMETSLRDNSQGLTWQSILFLESLDSVESLDCVDSMESLCDSICDNTGTDFLRVDSNKLDFTPPLYKIICYVFL